MAKQNINLGTTANDNTGDELRVAGQKINENFTEVYTYGFGGPLYDDIQPAGEFVPASGGAAPDVTTHTIGGIAMNFRSFDGGTTEETMTGNFEVLHGVDVDGLNRATAPLLAEVHTHGMPSTTGSGVVKIFSIWFTSQ
jgi:hypothetical protein